jgi:hypothetical protein
MRQEIAIGIAIIEIAGEHFPRLLRAQKINHSLPNGRSERRLFECRRLDWAALSSDPGEELSE